MNGGAERETYIGHEAQHLRGVLVLKRPIKNGIIQNWDEMEQVNEYISIMCTFLTTHSCHSNPCETGELTRTPPRPLPWLLDLASHIPANARGSRRSRSPADGSGHESAGEPPAHGGDHV